MKTFNKKLIASAIVASMFLGAGATFADGFYRQDRDPAQRLNYIFTQLQISEEQQQQITEIMQNVYQEQRQVMWEQMQTLRNADERPTQEEMLTYREEHRATQRQALTDQLNTVLDPSVTEDLVEYLDAHQAMGMGMREDRMDRSDRMNNGGFKPKGGQSNPQSQSSNGGGRN